MLLVLGWAAFLVPRAVRSRNASPHATVGGFERAMSVLRSDSPSSQSRRVFVPGDARQIVDRPASNGTAVSVRQADPVIERRRVWFVRLVAAAAVSVVLALVFNTAPVWFLAVGVSAALVGYAGVLRRLKLQRDEARHVVEELNLAAQRRPEREFKQAVGGGDEAAAAGVRLRRWDD